MMVRYGGEGYRVVNCGSVSSRSLCFCIFSPTNTYAYAAVGTKCTAQHNENYYYDGWFVSPLTNRNSSISLESGSGDITVDRYGVFNVNFKPFPPARPPPPPDYTFLFITVIVTSVIGWSIPSIAGWVKAERQLEHLKECVNMIDEDVGKSHQNAIKEKIMGYRVDGKLSEDHRQLLKDKISEYYGSVNGSESGV